MGKGDRWQVGKSYVVSPYIHATFKSSQYICAKCSSALCIDT